MTGSRCFIAVAALIIGSASVSAQSMQPAADSATAARIAWLRTHASPLRSIDAADENWSDLEPLRKAIGNSRMVFVGDPSHSMGNALSGQTRLVKFLHQQMGFDVLVFESGLYDVTKVWAAIRSGAPARQSFQMGIVPVWSATEQMSPLMEYVAAQAKGPGPLELAGYDATHMNAASRRWLVPELRAYVDSLGLSTFLDDSALWNGIQRLHGRSERDSATQARLAQRLNELREAVGARAQDPGGRFWGQVIASLSTSARFSVVTQEPESFNIRDEQGGRNLLWLADDRYRGRKLIVWSATLHAARNNSVVERSSGPSRSVPAGHYVWQGLGTEMYSLGFVALEGVQGLKDGGPADTASVLADQVKDVAELEEMLGAAGFERAFVDYRRPSPGGEWLQGRFVSRPFGNRANLAPWREVMDGIVFVRTSMPVTWWVAPEPPRPRDALGIACTDTPRLGCGLGPDQFALISAGTFQMGSSDESASPNERPAHTVTISRAFYLQKTEVSQGQWRSVMGANPSRFSSCGDTCPVEQVSWDGVQTFLQRLNARTPGGAYRLPTEAEWEYAARAGTTAAAYGAVDSIAWDAANSGGMTRPVATKQANAWGLHDMLGNVYEWVNDRFSAYPSAPVVDPSGPSSGANRVARGMAFGTPAAYVRSAYRMNLTPSTRNEYGGFRVIFVPDAVPMRSRDPSR